MKRRKEEKRRRKKIGEQRCCSSTVGNRFTPVELVGLVDRILRLFWSYFFGRTSSMSLSNSVRSSSVLRYPDLDTIPLFGPFAGPRNRLKKLSLRLGAIGPGKESADPEPDPELMRGRGMMEGGLDIGK